MRDQAFTIAFFGIMSCVWFGMAQEDPVPQARRPLWAASALGVIMAVAFGVVVGRNWDTPSALDKDVWWVFGGTFVVVSLFIGSGAIVLKIRDHYRWFGWWIGLCVAVHFAPLVWVFDDWSYLILSVVQVAGLVVMLPRLRRAKYETSRWACAWLGSTFLVFSIVSAIVFLARYGYPV